MTTSHGLRRLAALANKRHELVAPPARHDVRFAQDALEGLRDEADGLVARGVPVRVVELLEPVDVREDDHGRVLLAAGTRHLGLGEEGKPAAVRQPGEFVHERQRLQVALIAQLLPDVARQQHDRRLVEVEARPNRQLHVRETPRLAAQLTAQPCRLRTVARRE